ncbi:hypothetical protein GOP47_0006655 [Adiantum capillus-veneris]|uniref:Uncharacterized protein n=1 Tax=Adiantum capillus-veneris TaxID=13818 RepID=A0A9D4ZKM1_ADICA|nr:hypothetical protein GOP47_0005949 [Adiantum capillus-veneris]KAI5078984.1 hypothetical protein GOP47_0006655 [Adiantum capillus-veneris]
MKGHKGGGGKPSQWKGGLASGEREPLFPRLHVSETEKAGPKAPPRNKMALYEQFTVPSHRFYQPNQGSTFHQPYGSGYPYIPHYIPSAACASANTVPTYSQPSQVTSSSGITSGSMVVNMESHKAPRIQKVGNSSPCKILRSWTEVSVECLTNDVPQQRGKFRSSLNNDMRECTNCLGNIPTGKERTCTLDKTESSHEVMSTLKKGFKGMHPESLMKPTKSGVAAKMQTEDSGYSHDLITQSWTADECCVMQYDSSFELKITEESGAILAAEDQNLFAEGQGSESALASEKSSRTQPCCSALQTSLPDVKKGDKSEGVELGNSEIKRCKELKTKDQKHDVSQPACSGGSPDNSADFMPVIKPKDVILAIGQQQFWKARKTLLRQQRIFSDQVFQLHKLIMIQHLLAETPGTLIDEAVHFETVGECEAPPRLTKRTMNSGNCARNDGNSKKGSKSQSADVEGSPAVSKDVNKEVKVLSPDSIHGGISSWGYPSFGQWIGGPMAADGQPYGYQPLAGALPPGSAFGLPYGSALSGSASPMVSFWMPYCGQRQELPAEMGANYGPATVAKVDGSGFMGRNFGYFSNDFANSWYIMQHNNLNNQRMHSGKAAPTGSGASVNKAPVTTARGMKTSCFPGLAYHWGIGSQAAGPSNTEGFEASGQQSEISSPSIAARLAPPLTPSACAAKKLIVSNNEVQGGLGLKFDMVLSSDSRRSVENDEDGNAKMFSKVHEEGGRSPVDDRLEDASVLISDVGCALELFPLVPALRNQERDPNAVEEGRGHVIRAVPRRAIAASESAAGILLSLQREKQNRPRMRLC